MSLYKLEPTAVARVGAATKDDILNELARLFSENYGLEQDAVHERLEERERLGSTGFGRSVAIPHARLPDIKRPLAVFLRLGEPVEFDAADGLPVELVFGLISPENAGAAHLHALAAISRLMRDETVHESLLAASNDEAIFSLLSNVADRNAA